MNTQEDIRSILDALRRLVRELRVTSRHAEAESGLTAARLFVLERVAMNQPVSVNELAELTLTHQSSVSVVAHRLVDDGFLEQRLAPQDRRRKELSITPQGRAALKRAPTSVQDRLIAGLSAMGNANRGLLAQSLKKLTQAMGLQDAEPVLFFESERRGARGRPARPAPTARPRKTP